MCGTFDGAGLHGRMCVARTSIDAVRGLPEAERNYRPHVISIYQLFPNTIADLAGRPHRDLARLSRPRRSQPLRGRDDDLQAGRHRQAGAYWEKNRDIAIRTVMEEDFPLGERMQIGFELGVTEEVIYGRNEPSLVHFHSSIRNALGVAAA